MSTRRLELSVAQSHVQVIATVTLGERRCMYAVSRAASGYEHGKRLTGSPNSDGTQHLSLGRAVKER